MKKSKSSSSGDRLSELPDSLIFDIFWLLPIRDVVRTTILSKRWRDLWTTSPFLNFSGYRNFSDYRVRGRQDRARDFMNRALIRWRGVKLLKFKVMFKLRITKPLNSDINLWVRFAKDKEVEELYLDLKYPEGYDDLDVLTEEFQRMYQCSSLRAILYSCSSLRVLSIKDCPFFIGGNGNVKWDRLKSLTMHGYWQWDQDAITKILCGSPKLEVFFLTHVARGDNCCIQSGSLKKLSIDFMYDDHSCGNKELKILTPNLETLEISGTPCSALSVDVPCLTDITLGMHCLKVCGNCNEWCDSFEVEDTLKQILPSIQHVERVTLSECCIEGLGAMNKKSLLSPFSEVKFLKLNTPLYVDCFSKHEQIVGLLQIFPKLKKLVIQDNCLALSHKDENEDAYQDDREPLEFEANLPHSFLLQLRTVEVTWAEYDKSIFLFIETLLKYASKLEKMVFRVKGFKPSSPPTYPLFLASQKLLRMPRSSPTAQLIFCKY